MYWYFLTVCLPPFYIDKTFKMSLWLGTRNSFLLYIDVFSFHFSEEYLQISDNISDIQGFAVWGFSDKLKDAGISVLPLGLVAVWTFIFLTMAFGARVCGWVCTKLNKEQKW